MKISIVVLMSGLFAIAAQARIRCSDPAAPPTPTTCATVNEKVVAQDLLNMMKLGLGTPDLAEALSGCVDKAQGKAVCGANEMDSDIEARPPSSICSKASGRQFCLGRTDSVHLVKVRRVQHPQFKIPGEDVYYAYYEVMKGDGTPYMGRFGFDVFRGADYVDAHRLVGCGWFDDAPQSYPTRTIIEKSCWSSSSR